MYTTETKLNEGKNNNVHTFNLQRQKRNVYEWKLEC